MRFRSCAGATLFLFVILLAHGVRGSGYPDRGTNAPTFGPITWISTPTPAGVDLRGKVVVLEFGATWCEVCRMSIPHLNDLSKRFGGDSVVFVLISNESPQVVAQFLTENSLHPAVGCDTTGETYDAYDIRRIPRTFLIDANGVVSWYGHPNSITTDVLSRYLKSGDVPSIAFEADSLRIPELVQTAQPGFTLSVNHAQSGYRFGQQTETSSIEREESGRYVIEFKGRRLSEIISRLSREPVTRIRFNPELEFEPVFDLRLEVSTPMSFDAGRSKAIQIFCDALNLGIRERVITGRQGSIEGQDGIAIATVYFIPQENPAMFPSLAKFRASRDPSGSLEPGKLLFIANCAAGIERQSQGFSALLRSRSLTAPGRTS